MIDHISIAVRDLDMSADFYVRALAPLELTRLVERPNMIGFGKRYPELWLNARPAMAPLPADVGAHAAFRAPSPEAVTDFHVAALAAGGTCDGPPGPRAAAMTTYFGAFVRDPDGNRLEAVHFPRSAA
jgi:catechol 2,3-dioxygenase-like lactoylglutathione lyase family enzyme